MATAAAITCQSTAQSGPAPAPAVLDVASTAAFLGMTEKAVRARVARRLIPFVKEYLSRVDVAEGRIEVDLPAGLVEICESKS